MSEYYVRTINDTAVELAHVLRRIDGERAALICECYEAETAERIAAARLEANAERRQEERFRQTMTPEEFANFKAEREAERRHREICRSIEQAGENARFRLW